MSNVSQNISNLLIIFSNTSINSITQGNAGLLYGTVSDGTTFMTSLQICMNQANGNLYGFALLTNALTASLQIGNASITGFLNGSNQTLSGVLVAYMESSVVSIANVSSSINVINYQYAGFLADIVGVNASLTNVNISGVWSFVMNFAQGGTCGMMDSGANLSLLRVSDNISILTKQQNSSGAHNYSSVGVWIGMAQNLVFYISIVNCTSYFSTNYS